MKIKIGGFGQPEQVLDVPRLEFVAEDGRTMFEVWIGRDGHSIEIKGVSVCKVGGVLYESRFAVEPAASNAATVRALRYERA